MKTLKKVLLYSLIAFVIMQFAPVNRSNPPVDGSKDFVEVMDTPPEIAKILRNSCYDCHTNETKYPQYAYVAPLSWSIKHHINEGREHANFSVWGNYNEDLKKNILENAVQSLEDRKMPMPGYVAYHPEANLSPDDRKTLSAYFESILQSGQQNPSK